MKAGGRKNMTHHQHFLVDADKHFPITTFCPSFILEQKLRRKISFFF